MLTFVRFTAAWPGAVPAPNFSQTTACVNLGSRGYTRWYPADKPIIVGGPNGQGETQAVHQTDPGAC